MHYYYYFRAEYQDVLTFSLIGIFLNMHTFLNVHTYRNGRTKGMIALLLRTAYIL